MRKEERFRTWGFLLIDFSQEQQFSNWVLQRRVSRGFLQGAKSRPRRQDSDVPTSSSQFILIVLYVGALLEILSEGEKSSPTIYLFTSIQLIWRLEDLCLLLWFCLKECKVLCLYLFKAYSFVFMDLQFNLIVLLRSEREG